MEINALAVGHRSLRRIAVLDVASDFGDAAVKFFPPKHLAGPEVEAEGLPNVLVLGGLGPVAAEIEAHAWPFSTGPLLIALSRKTLSPQATGQAQPRPGILVFQATFSVALHESGRRGLSATPPPASLAREIEASGQRRRLVRRRRQPRKARVLDE